MTAITPLRAIAAACLLFCAAPALAEPAHVEPAHVEPARVEPSFLDVEGGRLAWQTCGSGPRNVVLLHDGILHSAAFDEVWNDLCRRYRVVRYDRRGYGASTPADAPYQPLRDLEAVLRAADMPHAALIGSSAGSGLAVDYALAHPEQVDSLVLVGPWVSGFEPSFGFILRGLKLLALFRLGAVDLAVRDPYILTRGAADDRRRVAALLRAHPGNVAASMNERSPRAAQPLLGRIVAPTLILTGQVDIGDVQRQAAALETAIPGARRIVVPDSGHLMYLERPAAFVDQVAAFIDATPVSR